MRGGERYDSVRCLLDQKTSSPAHTGQRFSGCLLCAMFSLGRGMRCGRRDDSVRCLLDLKTRGEWLPFPAIQAEI
jgi:hypothetical protein